MLYPHFRNTRMRNPESAFSEQHHIFPPKHFFAKQVAEHFLALIPSIAVAMVESIDAELQAKPHNVFHGLLRFLYVVPAVKSVNSGRDLGPRIADIYLVHWLTVGF